MATTTTADETTTGETIELRELDPTTAAIIERAIRDGGRITIARDRRPVAAVLSIGDVDRFDRFEAQRKDAFAVFDEIGAAFADVDPEEIEREVASALAEVRAEMRFERAAGTYR